MGSRWWIRLAMKENKKKNKDSIHKSEEAEVDEAIRLIALAVADETERSIKISTDPLDVYAQSIQRKLHDDIDRFSDRLAKGYQILQAEIATIA